MENCCVCQKPNSSLQCALCEEGLCKKCAHFLEQGQFHLWDERPEYLDKAVFCYPCYVNKIEKMVSTYEEQLVKAKNISIFYDNQGKETRKLSRKEIPFVVSGMADRDETLLKLAFKAVLAGFNGLIDVSITSEKVRTGSYQTSVYKGTGIPTELPDRKIATS